MSQDFNDKLKNELEAQGENLLKVLKAAIDADRLYTVECPKKCCQTGAKFSAKFPDVATMLKAAQWWTEYVHGKASARPTKPKEDGKAKSLVYTSMTDEQLGELLGR